MHTYLVMSYDFQGSCAFIETVIKWVDFNGLGQLNKESLRFNKLYLTQETSVNLIAFVQSYNRLNSVQRF